MQFWDFSVLQRHGVSPPGGDFYYYYYYDYDYDYYYYYYDYDYDYDYYYYYDYDYYYYYQGRAAAATGAAGGFYVSLYKQWYNNSSKTIKTCRKLYCFSRVSEGTLGSFGARWMVFPCREVIFSMVFFHPGTSRSSSKSLCSSFRSYVVQFWGFSVLHCHGVFPSRDQQQQQKPLQQQEEKGAKSIIFYGFQKLR